MKIAIVEDHLLLAESVSGLLRSAIEGSETKIFVTGDLFLQHNFNLWRPDIVLSDILMPGTNGIDMLGQAVALLGEGTQFILVSSVIDIYTIKNAIRKGAKAYVSKGAESKELLEAIRTVRDGGVYISQALKEDLVKHVFEEEQAVYHLSPRENEVLQLVCGGSMPKEIAAKMELSIHTVNQYIKVLMRKFKVNRTTEVVVFAMQNGLYSPGL